MNAYKQFLQSFFLQEKVTQKLINDKWDYTFTDIEKEFTKKYFKLSPENKQYLKKEYEKILKMTIKLTRQGVIKGLKKLNLQPQKDSYGKCYVEKIGKKIYMPILNSHCKTI